ncbi:MAG: glycosyltransferase [PVC group bacterium]|nr:glycosyltransferase [PVC group bacterium]
MLTVIMPTYNRKDVLFRVLDAFNRQTFSLSNFEIIIVDDGSTDGTRESILQYCQSCKISIRYLFQENKGPAIARNRGIKEAKYPLVLFINDDTIPADDFLEQHVICHKKWPDENIAILGYATWAEGIPVPIFASHYLIGEFDKIKGLEEARPIDFITCNISAKKDFLINNGLFDEDFPYAAHEDRELGHRLGKKGLRIKYNPNACVYHYHIFEDPKPFILHNKRLGAALAIWESKLTDERNVLFEFGLRDYSSLEKIIKEVLRELFFNSKVLPLWLWIISKFIKKESFQWYIYSHLMAQAQNEGFRSRKFLMRLTNKRKEQNVS